MRDNNTGSVLGKFLKVKTRIYLMREKKEQRIDVEFKDKLMERT